MAAVAVGCTEAGPAGSLCHTSRKGHDKRQRNAAGCLFVCCPNNWNQRCPRPHTLPQEPLDTSLPGYQPPLPESEVKPLQVRSRSCSKHSPRACKGRAAPGLQALGTPTLRPGWLQGFSELMALHAPVQDEEHLAGEADVEGEEGGRRGGRGGRGRCAPVLGATR